MKLPATLGVVAAIVLTACENPVQPPQDGGPQPSALARSVGAESSVHLASTFCHYNWDWPEGYFCSLNVTSTGSVPCVAAEWMNWTNFDLIATAPTWSPDATKIAFTDGSDVQVVSLVDGRLTNLTNHPAVDASPAWSPNGSKIVFKSDRDGRAELYVMNADGSNAVRLTYNAGVDPSFSDPDWAPDGSRIAFTCQVESGNRDICRINADGTGLVRLTTDPTTDFAAAWSPDGRRIAFVSGSQLKLMNADGSGATQVATSYWLPRAPDWSPDGSRLVFQGTAQGGTGCPADGIGCPDDIVIMNVDGTAPQVYYNGWAPAWAPTTPSLPADQPPVARFTYWCSGLTCQFDASASTDDRRTLAALSWTFGDGTSGASESRHTYAAAGTYTVTLTVTDGAGQSASTSQAVTVTAPDLPPFASFGWGCAGLTCNFNSAGSSDDVGIVSRSWAFGDGSTAGNVVAPAKTFAAAGTYAVTLTVIDTKGQSSSRSESVTVSDLPPTARFTSSCVRTACTFDGRSSTDELGVASYSWDLGASSRAPVTGAVVSLDYKRSGTFSVRLTVRDPGGQEHSVTQQITVRK